MNNVDHPENSQTIISIATGMGGLERGIERAGTPINVAAYVEIEAFIIANLVAAMETGKLAPAPVWADVKTFPYRNFYKRIHGIIAGYPCQPFSQAGKRKGVKDPRHLWPFIFRVYQSIKPFWGFFENVEGHLNLGFDEVSRDLRKLGYHTEAGLFSAEEVGAPHRRKRLFILAVMAHTYQYDRGTNHREFPGQTKTPERTPQGKNRQRVRPEPRDSSKDVADTCGKGLQITTCRGLQSIQQKGRTSEGSQFSRVFTKSERWPARPGEPQHPWENPRTIKPGMGCSAHGYNFREDLLRMYGNGVVEQTAAKAWITLWNKMKNI